MAVTKKVRDELLVEAQHRCTICSERCFDIHHIVEQADGGSDETDNLIVLCPNCHQHRLHRHGEFTRDQILLYKAKLKESAEVEKRLLQNLGDIKTTIAEKSAAEVESQLKTALAEAISLIDPTRKPRLAASIQETACDLAEASLMPEAARRAIELQYDVAAQQEKARFPEVSVLGVDEDGWRKSDALGRAYAFVILLDIVPPREWCDVFNQKWRQSFYNMMRETSIRENRVIMIVADSDNLQNHTDWIKRMVRETNEWIRTEGFFRIDIQIGQAKRKALDEFDAIQSMKKRGREIHI